MNAIRNVFAALANLAASINDPKGDVATGRLRQQLALEESPAPVLEHQGEVLDGSTEPAPGSRRNGRVAKATS